MKSVLLIFLSSVCLLFKFVNAADCISCNNCINGNLPKQDGQYMLYASHFNDCDAQKDYSSFRILTGNGFNGCGYADNINALYNKCANECSTCQKEDSGCATALDHPSSTIKCTPSPCVQRGESLAFGRICCDGLQRLGFKCIDPNQDCTPCSHKIEANKPCCDSSGINAGGICKCTNPFASCTTCKFDNKCSGGKRCISGCCT